jgi:hypothetical protein
MTPYLDKGIFTELKDSNLFNTVKVNFDTVEWANEADLDPEFLYEESVKYEFMGVCSLDTFFYLLSK